jgi:hypothetical protein
MYILIRGYMIPHNQLSTALVGPFTTIGVAEKWLLDKRFSRIPSTDDGFNWQMSGSCEISLLDRGITTPASKLEAVIKNNLYFPSRLVFRW